MKKFTGIIVLLLLLTSTLFGNIKLKINPGTWLINGGFSYLFSQAFEESSEPVFEINLNAGTGYFITPNTIVGIHFNISLGINNDPTNNLDFRMGFESIGIQGRYLFTHTEPVNFYFGIDISFGFVIRVGPGVPPEEVLGKEHLLIGSPIGIYIPLNPYIALDIYTQPVFYIPLNTTSPYGLGIPIIIGFAIFI